MCKFVCLNMVLHTYLTQIYFITRKLCLVAWQNWSYYQHAVSFQVVIQIARASSRLSSFFTIPIYWYFNSSLYSKTNVWHRCVVCFCSYGWLIYFISFIASHCWQNCFVYPCCMQNKNKIIRNLLAAMI